MSRGFILECWTLELELENNSMFKQGIPITVHKIALHRDGTPVEQFILLVSARAVTDVPENLLQV